MIILSLADEINPKILGKLFTVLSHHRNISGFFLVQNIYFRGIPNMRLININSHYTGEFL